MLLKALCTISKPSANENWSCSPETPKLGQNWWFFVPYDLTIWWITFKNNWSPLRCYFKLCAYFLLNEFTHGINSLHSCIHARLYIVLNRCNTMFFLVNVLTIFSQYFGRQLWVWRLTDDLPLSLPCCTQHCVITDRVINEYQQYINQHLLMYTNVTPSNIFSSVISFDPVHQCILPRGIKFVNIMR